MRVGESVLHSCGWIHGPAVAPLDMDEQHVDVRGDAAHAVASLDSSIGDHCAQIGNLLIRHEEKRSSNSV